MDSLLKPPKSGLIKKVGPAETGHLTPARSRSASRSSTCSTSNLAPASPSSGSDIPVGNTRPSGITFERSRSSGRLVSSENGGGVGELKRGAASSASASTSVLANISSAAGSGGGIGGQTASKTSPATTYVASTSSLSTIQSNGGSKSTAVESANARSKGQAPQSSSTSPSSSATAEHRKSVKILQQWRKKTSMSKLGKGTRSLVSKPINQVVH